MKIIVIGKRRGRTRSFTLGGWTKSLISVCLVGIPVGLGSWLAAEKTPDILDGKTTEAWSDALQKQAVQVKEATDESEQKIAALTLRVAELQARLVRLDALGDRLTKIAKLDSGEFDFSRKPALGGPEKILDDRNESNFADFQQSLMDLGAKIEDRQQQLATLETLLANRKILNDVFIAGRPIKKGWMSSRFGRRTDPFSGRVAWHEGVDFAGKEGSEIIAVASGVVTWSGDNSGYGYMVEINHGNGFSTRYAHCKENLVKVGDVVKKGQVVALMGSTGRSTGPHVHFEVYKNGRAVDPSSYIHRASR